MVCSSARVGVVPGSALLGVVHTDISVLGPSDLFSATGVMLNRENRPPALLSSLTGRLAGLVGAEAWTVPCGEAVEPCGENSLISTPLTSSTLVSPCNIS